MAGKGGRRGRSHTTEIKFLQLLHTRGYPTTKTLPLISNQGNAFYSLLFLHYKLVT